MLEDESVVLTYIFHIGQWDVTTSTSTSKLKPMLAICCLVKNTVGHRQAFESVVHVILQDYGNLRLVFSKLFTVSVFKLSIINKSFWLMKLKYAVVWFTGHVTYSYICKWLIYSSKELFPSHATALRPWLIYILRKWWMVHVLDL